MQADPEMRITEHPKLEKIGASPQPQLGGAAEISDSPKQTLPQIVLSDGWPPAAGAAAAMAIIGAPISTILAIGLMSGLGFTLLRSRSQP